MQWVPYCRGYNCEETMPSDHKRSGIGLNAQAGYMLFRTYDINLMVRFQYHLVFNTDLDQGIAIDAGVIKKPRPKSESSRTPLQNIASGIGNTYLFFVALGLLGIMMN